MSPHTRFGVLNMIKPYKGQLRKNGKLIHFYDEREWRYLTTNPYNTSNKNGRNSNKKKQCNKELERLDFQGSDIKYIIVSKQEELSDIRGRICDLEKYSEVEKRSLGCKVISAQAIKEDF